MPCAPSETLSTLPSRLRRKVKHLCNNINKIRVESLRVAGWTRCNCASSPSGSLPRSFSSKKNILRKRARANLRVLIPRPDRENLPSTWNSRKRSHSEIWCNKKELIMSGKKQRLWRHSFWCKRRSSLPSSTLGAKTSKFTHQAQKSSFRTQYHVKSANPSQYIVTW